MKRTLENLLEQVDVAQATTLAEAGALLENEAGCDLLVSGIGFRDGDSLDWLQEVISARRTKRIFIVTSCREIRTHLVLGEMTLNGMFDPMEAGLDELSYALQLVLSGGYYLSPSFHDLLHPADSTAVDLTRNLTPKEQLVMTAIGDGSDDTEAAGRLNMSTGAVRSHRKRLHAKLGINHRGELMRLALTHGFVRVAHNEIVRPGFASLLRRVSQPPWERSASS